MYYQIANTYKILPAKALPSFSRDYSRQLKHFLKTYITQEDLFINGRISMQHSNYQTTSKHYIDRKQIAKEMVKQGFMVFPKQSIEG